MKLNSLTLNVLQTSLYIQAFNVKKHQEVLSFVDRKLTSIKGTAKKKRPVTIMIVKTLL